MTSRMYMRVCLSALIIIGTAAIIGCDERNEPDLPTVVYTLKKNIVTPGVALHVDAEANMLAIAASSAGTYVYDISNSSEPTEVFHYEQRENSYSSHAAIDAVNELVVTASLPNDDPVDRFPIHLYRTATRIGGAAISQPIADFEIISSQNKMTVWRTDATDGFAEDSYCYIPDSARWRPDYCTEFYFGYIPNNVNIRLRGFANSGDLFAIAQNNFEIVVHDVVTGIREARFSTPGDPQDVAWIGNYLFVADNFHLTVVNVANLDTPVVVKTLTIPGADRLQRIVVDGSYATLLDDADGLYVVDISTATDPKHVQTINLPEVSAVTATNGKIIASDEQLGILIYER